MNSGMKGALLVLLASLCFSISGTLQAFAPDGATPLVVTEARMIVGSLFLLVWCAGTGQFPFPKKDINIGTILFLSGCLLIGQLCFFTGMFHVGVSTGTIISVGSCPLWAAIINGVLTKKLPPVSWFIATFFAICGIVFINGFEWQASRFGYIALLLGDGFCYALYIIYSSRTVASLGSDRTVFLVLSVIAVCLLPALFFFPVGWTLEPRGILVCLGLGIFTAGCAFTFLTAGSKLISPVAASTLSLAEPMGAACWGIFLLGEDSSPRSLTGIALILLSIIILVIAESRAEHSKK
jgi:DME family drug/metabolite transporter